MKKILLFLFLLPALPVILSAQSNTPGNGEEPAAVEFGVKGTLSLPSFFWLEDLSWNQVTMFALQGGFWGHAAFNITEEFAIQAEIGYCGKGASLDASDGSIKWYFDYLEIPVWLKWSVRTPESAFWLGAGGYYGYCLGGRYTFNVPGSEWNSAGAMTIGSREIISEIRQHDAGLIFIIGGEENNIEYEIKFPVGLIPAIAFTPEDQISYGGYRKALNSGIMLCIGYKF